MSVNIQTGNGLIQVANKNIPVNKRIEFKNKVDFPTVGEENKLYVAVNENAIYRFDIATQSYICLGSNSSISIDDTVTDVTDKVWSAKKTNDTFEEVEQSINDVDAKFADYDTSDEVDSKITNALADYEKSADVDTKLAEYDKSTVANKKITDALADYDTSEVVDNKLKDYAKTTEVDTKLVDYYKKTETYSNAEVDDKFTDLETTLTNAIKTWVDSEESLALKTTLYNNNTLTFYKKPNATVDDTADFSINLPVVPEYTIAKLETTTEGYVASYQLKKGNTTVGDTINIPKDYLVKSAEIKTVDTADTPVSGYAIGDKYIDFVVNTVNGDGNESHIYLLVSDLAKTYSAGNGIDISATNVVSVVAQDGTKDIGGITKADYTSFTGAVTKADANETAIAAINNADTGIEAKAKAYIDKKLGDIETILASIVEV